MASKKHRKKIRKFWNRPKIRVIHFDNGNQMAYCSEKAYNDLIASCGIPPQKFGLNETETEFLRQHPLAGKLFIEKSNQ